MTIHDAYEVDKRTMYDLGDGIKDWMTASATSGSVTTERTMGGRAFMDAGGTAGESAEVQFGSVNPSPVGRFDVFGIRFIFSLGSDASSGGNATVRMGLESGESHIRHHPNHVTDGEAGTITVSDSGESTTQDTRSILTENILSSELIWDYSAGNLYHRYQDCLAQQFTDDSVLPDPTQDYTPTARIESADLDSGDNAIMFLYGVEITYYSNPNPV